MKLAEDGERLTRKLGARSAARMQPRRHRAVEFHSPT